MTATHKNFLKTTISAVASSGLGALTISAASSGYRTFGAGEDGKTFDGVTIKEGTAWEVRDGCVYTHSGTSLSRGTLMDSSTGSAIAFTSAAVVSQGGTAEFAGRVEQVALRRVTGTDASITLEANTHYVWDLSILTADRTGTLPTTAAVGDVIEISAITSNASFELLLRTGSGQTCAFGSSVVAASTEITRLFIAGESMRFVYEATNKWSVMHDGRIPQQCGCRLTTSATAESAATVTTPTDKGGAWTSYIDNASLAVVSTSDIKTRRAGNFVVSFAGTSTGTVADGKYFSVYLYKNGTTNIMAAGQFSQAQATIGRVGQQSILTDLAADDYIKFRWRSEEGSKGLDTSPSPGLATAFSLVEVL